LSHVNHRTPRLSQSVRSAWLAALLVVLGGHVPARAGPKPLPPEEQTKVNDAIDRGVLFLVKTQGPLGTWASKDDHVVGYAALPGLTLLECGLSPADPAVKKAAAFVRKNCAVLENTYELSLALLFLDRLGEARDNKLIQTLGMRLVAGQSPSGGWTYCCPLLNANQHRQLFEALSAADFKPERLPPALRGLPAVQEPVRLATSDPPDKRETAIWGTTDNSNTQFAVLAVWTARRHGVPTERTLERIAQRFRATQGRQGGWGYAFPTGTEGRDSPLNHSPTMTCAGLLGLAVGHGLAHDAAAARKGPPAASAVPAALGLTASASGAGLSPAISWLAMLGPALPGLAPLPEPKKIGPDPLIRAGFQALYRYVGKPTGRMEGVPARNLYFLWSLERVGVLYDLETLGDKDWYRWGAEVLVSNQYPQGHWQEGRYTGATPTINTCLALLFLKRANLTLDLTARLPFNPAELGPPAEPEPTTPQPQTPPPPPPEPVLTGVKPSPLKVSAPGPEEAREEAPSSRSWIWLVLLAAFVLLFSGAVLLTQARSSNDKERAANSSRKSRGGRKRKRVTAE
jgi:cell division septation protein DedD